MRLSSKVTPKNSTLHAMPPSRIIGGNASAIVDPAGKMLAYKRHDIGKYGGEWDWVKKSAQG